MFFLRKEKKIHYLIYEGSVQEAVTKHIIAFMWCQNNQKNEFPNWKINVNT